MTHSQSGSIPGGVSVARRSIGVAALILAAALVAACSASATSPSPANTLVPTSSPSDTVLASSATPADTSTPATTPTPAPTSSVTPTKAPTKAPVVVATPLPPLAIGLCTGAQLKLTIASWQNDGSISYAHIQATNVSSASCGMRGKPRTQIVDGKGTIITDAGSAGGEISAGDPVYTLAPNGVIYDIATWGNWCKAAPTQNVAVAVVMPFSLGRLVAKPNGAAPIPSCYSSGTPPTLSAEAWLP